MCWVLKDWYSLAHAIREPGNVFNFKRLVVPIIYYERARKCAGILKDWYSLVYTISELGNVLDFLKHCFALADAIAEQENVLDFERLVFPSIYYNRGGKCNMEAYKYLCNLYIVIECLHLIIKRIPF